MRVIGLAGWSGSGKTTLVTKVIPVLVGRGLKVATVKHAHHDFDTDQPGKDSWLHRRAGASEVAVVSSRRWAIVHELGDEAEPSLDDVLAKLSPADLVIVEGFKRHPHPKLEVYRAVVGKPLALGPRSTAPREAPPAAEVGDGAMVCAPEPMLTILRISAKWSATA